MVTYPGATCSQYWASIMHIERMFFAGRNPSGSLAMGVLQVSNADCRVYARRSRYAHPNAAHNDRLVLPALHA